MPMRRVMVLLPADDKARANALSGTRGAGSTVGRGILAERRSRSAARTAAPQREIPTARPGMVSEPPHGDARRRSDRWIPGGSPD
jgi:hypothetical protein